MDYEDCTADDISDEELIRLDMMYDEVRALLKPDFIHEYVACYIQALYKYKFAERKTTPMYNHIYSCIQDFNCVNMEDIDFEMVKEILINKYKLKVIKEEPYLELEEI